MLSTPVVSLGSDHLGNQLYMKRDDLLPFSFGGNKVRIAQEFFAHMRKQGNDCIVGYGNARSNLSRAIANMAASKGIACHIISPTDDDGTRTQTGNSRIVSACDATFHICNKDNVAQTVAAVMEQCRKEGLSPYYIYGDRFGRGNEATAAEAYAKAYDEIHRGYDYIFLATGTGMTQAGLLAGRRRNGGKETIVGISVARSAQMETEILKRYTDAYTTKYGLEPIEAEDIHVTDAYLCGGYGSYDERITDTIFRVLRTYGIPLDPTYTGKAFYGMEEYLRMHNIREKRVLFLHTGGTPLFFDLMTSPCVTSCRDAGALLTFLQRIDTSLPTSLSSRVDLNAYAQKVLQSGRVLCVEHNGDIVCAALFYCNDHQSGNAYLTLLGTLPEYEGKGYGSLVLSAAEQAAKREGMTSFHLDTEYQNTHAVQFYRRHGYTTSYTSEKLHMAKELCS